MFNKKVFSKISLELKCRMLVSVGRDLGGATSGHINISNKIKRTVADMLHLSERTNHLFGCNCTKSCL